ncbi:putative cysteine proteinase inhibitor 7 [Curcuma longa]|uniref:putative cysteine proteinase inhibitor 7 n=1 Tax=Curcuma longa TaxID=136217 RepID=UPI003D9E9A11
MKPFSPFLLLLPLLLLICNAGAITGGWTPIGDLHDPHILDIVEFAISEHNKQAHTKLTLTQVVKGESQVVAGINYRLLLQVKNLLGGGFAEYEAVVWEKPSDSSRQLLSFTRQPGVLVGEWEPIRNASGDPEVRGIAEFAVAEHNREAKRQLRFVSVVEGEEQVVAGMKYRLVLRARDGGGKEAEYEAVVWEKALKKFRQLISFTLLPNQN